MKNILPVSQPLITSYPGIAAAMSVLGTDERYMKWIVNNFNNLVYLSSKGEGEWSRGDFYDVYYPYYGLTFEKIPFFESNRFNKSFIDIICGGIVNFIIKCIDNDYYIYLTLNNYYIPYSHAYMKFDFRHPTFIYGYDTDNYTVNIADFYDGQKYGFYTITFEELCNAFKESFSPIHYNQVMNAFRVIKSYDLSNNSYNFEFVAAGLIDYFRSEDKIMEHAKSDSFNGNIPSFGLSYFDKLISDTKRKTASIQAFHVLCDHAIVTKRKIEIIYEDHLLEEETYARLKCEIENIKHQALLCRNVFMKNSMSENTCGIERLVERLKKLRDMNEHFTEHWIEIVSAMKDIQDPNK